MTDKNVCRCHLGLESAGILRASSGSTSLSLGRERRWGPGIGCPGRAAAPLAGRLDCRRGAGGGVSPGLSFVSCLRWHSFPEHAPCIHFQLRAVKDSENQRRL